MSVKLSIMRILNNMFSFSLKNSCGKIRSWLNAWPINQKQQNVENGTKLSIQKATKIIVFPFNYLH